jgi:arylsulfatase A-like enzyme
VLDDGYADEAVEKLGKHKPAGPLRGGKSTVFEGGTREPFLVRWPGHVPAGKTSDALVCQIDLLASLAALTEQKLPNLAGPDSVNVLPALLGNAPQGRESLVEQGRAIAVRQGKWKLIEAGDGPKAAPQLYNLADDLGETRNLAAKEPARVAELSQLLESIRHKGRQPAAR